VNERTERLIAGHAAVAHALAAAHRVCCEKCCKRSRDWDHRDCPCPCHEPAKRNRS
jgi:hypothetical protein